MYAFPQIPSIQTNLQKRGCAASGLLEVAVSDIPFQHASPIHSILDEDGWHSR